MQPIFSETKKIGQIFPSSKTQHEWVFKILEDKYTVTLKLSHRSHKLELTVNGNIIIKPQKLEKLDRSFPLRFTINNCRLEIRKNGKEVDLYNEGQSFLDKKRHGSQRRLVKVNKNCVSQRGIRQVDNYFGYQRADIPLNKNSGPQRANIPLKINSGSKRGSIPVDKYFSHQKESTPGNKDSGSSTNVTKDGSGTGMGIKMGRTSQLEKLADNFMDVDFRDVTRGKHVIYSMVHGERIFKH